MSDDLKPCPFCGVGVRAMSRYHPRDPNEWYVSCGARDCVMQPETPTYRTEAEAAEAWNRRPDTRREALEEAAKVADRRADYWDSKDDGVEMAPMVAGAACAGVAIAIRTLSPIDAPPSIYDGLVDPKRTRRVT